MKQSGKTKFLVCGIILTPLCLLLVGLPLSLSVRASGLWTSRVTCSSLKLLASLWRGQRVYCHVFLIMSPQKSPLTFLLSKTRHILPLHICFSFKQQSVRLMLLFSGWMNAYIHCILNADAVFSTVWHFNGLSAGFAREDRELGPPPWFHFELLLKSSEQNSCKSLPSWILLEIK